MSALQIENKITAFSLSLSPHERKRNGWIEIFFLGGGDLFPTNFPNHERNPGKDYISEITRNQRKDNSILKAFELIFKILVAVSLQMCFINFEQKRQKQINQFHAYKKPTLQNNGRGGENEEAKHVIIPAQQLTIL